MIGIVAIVVVVIVVDVLIDVFIMVTVTVIVVVVCRRRGHRRGPGLQQARQYCLYRGEVWR